MGAHAIKQKVRIVKTLSYWSFGGIIIFSLVIVFFFIVNCEISRTNRFFIHFCVITISTLFSLFVCYGAGLVSLSTQPVAILVIFLTTIFGYLVAVFSYK